MKVSFKLLINAFSILGEAFKRERQGIKMVIKCKMCGGDLALEEGNSIGTCEYCGSTMTVPSIDDEKLANLYNRANHFRMKSEFDKAAVSYENIIAENMDSAEAYWGLCLCKYGIEYVDDPVTGDKKPTCHRTQFTSILEDSDYLQAFEKADSVARRLYEQEAQEIDRIQKQILEISSHEKPFDIFICYKESDENGERTRDSVIAQELYYELSDEGYKVFFARITLESKLGTAYEPYIFAALNSAKVMIVVGTKPEYMNAVWVKNEWSRFLAMMRQGQKKMLIPAYRDMDPYDMPEEFASLQAQDMSKIGFMQDLIRGIDKILNAGKSANKFDREPIMVQGELNKQAAALVKRGNMALEDGEWERANDFFEQALNINVEYAEAYWGKLLSSVNCSDAEEFIGGLIERLEIEIKENAAMGIQTEEQKEAGSEDIEKIDALVEKYQGKQYASECEIRSMCSFDFTYVSSVFYWEWLCKAYRDNKLLKRAMSFATGDFQIQLQKIYHKMDAILEERLVEEKRKEEETASKIIQEYQEHLNGIDAEIDNLIKEKKYLEADSYVKSRQVEQYKRAASIFKSLKGYKDSEKLERICEEKIENILKPRYEHYIREMNVADTIEEYVRAKADFESLGDYQDSKEMALKCEDFIKEKRMDEAINRKTQEKNKRFAKLFTVMAGVCGVVAVLVYFLITS